MKIDRLRKISVVGLVAMALFSFKCTPKPSKTITEDDNGSRVEIKAGEVLAVELKAQMGTGFSWTVVSGSEGLKQLGKPELSPIKDQKPGGPELQVFKFKAVGTGEVPLTMHYTKPWKKDAKPEKEFSATIVIN